MCWMPIALTIKQTKVEEEHDSGNQGTAADV